ncbi:hypothetical protein Tco_0409747 [Tanacetum coccineum]
MGTATYGKIWYDEDVHDLRSVETEFPAIVFDDTFTSELTHSCKPMVSPPNDNKIDFRISFDESDDEDYTDLTEKKMTTLVKYLRSRNFKVLESGNFKAAVQHTISSSINAH